MRHSNEPLIVIFLGKSGSGKGTQALLLAERLGLEYVDSGTLLRKRKLRKDFTGKKISRIIDKGGLVPTPVIFKLWLEKFEELKKKKNFKGLVSSGSPRKLLEAFLIDEVLGWYEWDKNVKVFLIDVSTKEAVTRLLKRGREDDTISGIKRRMVWFKTNVQPVINFYRKSKRLIKINGEQSVENVYKDILKVLKR